MAQSYPVPVCRMQGCWYSVYCILWAGWGPDWLGKKILTYLSASPLWATHIYANSFSGVGLLHGRVCARPGTWVQESAAACQYCWDPPLFSSHPILISAPICLPLPAKLQKSPVCKVLSEACCLPGHALVAERIILLVWQKMFNK